MSPTAISTDLFGALDGMLRQAEIFELEKKHGPADAIYNGLIGIFLSGFEADDLPFAIIIRLAQYKSGRGEYDAANELYEIAINNARRLKNEIELIEAIFLYSIVKHHQSEFEISEKVVSRLFDLLKKSSALSDIRMFGFYNVFEILTYFGHISFLNKKLEQSLDIHKYILFNFHEELDSDIADHVNRRIDALERALGIRPGTDEYESILSKERVYGRSVVNRILELNDRRLAEIKKNQQKEARKMPDVPYRKSSIIRYIENVDEDSNVADFERLMARQVIRKKNADNQLPKWGDPDLPSDLKSLTAPLFLKTVYSALIIDGMIDPTAVRESDSSLMAAVDQYIFRRKSRNKDAGDATDLQFVHVAAQRKHGLGAPVKDIPEPRRAARGRNDGQKLRSTDPS